MKMFHILKILDDAASESFPVLQNRMIERFYFNGKATNEIISCECVQVNVQGHVHAYTYL